MPVSFSNSFAFSPMTQEIQPSEDMTWIFRGKPASGYGLFQAPRAARQQERPKARASQAGVFVLAARARCEAHPIKELWHNGGFAARNPGSEGDFIFSQTAQSVQDEVHAIVM